MSAFKGFLSSETFTAIPDTVFRELLQLISGEAELKIVLHALWRIEHLDATRHSLNWQDFSSAALGLSTEQVKEGLAEAIEHSILLVVGAGNDSRYFLNSPRGRAAAEALRAGVPAAAEVGSSLPLERPTIFRLYEENIGPLTPLVADALKDAEETYPASWLPDAIQLAAKNNKRSWSYCEAILRRWKEEGRGQKQNRRDDQATRQRDTEEKIRKFIRG
jgi:DnaD/phage-associated family protein